MDTDSSVVQQAIALLSGNDQSEPHRSLFFGVTEDLQAPSVRELLICPT